MELIPARIRRILRASSLALPVAAALMPPLAAGCAADDVPTDHVEQVVRPLSTIQRDSFFRDTNGWDVPSAYLTIRYPNVGGDARSDVCGRKSDGVWCEIDNGLNTLANPLRWSTLFTDANGWNIAKYYNSIQFPDLNGDGKADICGWGPSAPNTLAPGVLCGISNGVNSFGPITLWASQFSAQLGWDGGPFYNSTIKFPDLDGNGSADVCGRGVGGIWCGLNAGGSSFTAASLWSGAFYDDASGWQAAKYYTTIAFPDLNGDGWADVCGRGPDAFGRVRVWCGLSNGGNGFGDPVEWNATFGDPAWDDVQYYSTIQFADVNGDGFDDLCGRGPGGGAGSTIGVWCALSNGSYSFGTPTPWNTTIGNSNWSSAPYYSTIRVGKGLVCGRYIDGIYCAYSNGTTFNGSTFEYERRESTNETDAAGWSDVKYYSTIRATDDFKIAARGTAGIWEAPMSRDNLSIHTPPDVSNRRTTLIRKVWNRDSIDTAQLVDTVSPPTVTASLDTLPLPMGTTVSRYQFNMQTLGSNSVIGVADHFVPPGPPTRLVVINPGHSETCHYTRLPNQDAQAVVDLLNEGYGVLATYMPTYNPLDCSKAHRTLFNGQTIPRDGTHPYVYFLDPVRRGINQALHDVPSYNKDRVDMVGISGGGWTTTVYAALDTRIVTSIPVAGTEPFYMRPYADTEQENNVADGNDFFSFFNSANPNSMVVTGYKDLYALGAYGVPGRRQIQVLNRDDDCCFSPRFYSGQDFDTGVLSWDQAVRSHELEVRWLMYNLGIADDDGQTFGNLGSFRLEVNEADDTCAIAGTCSCPPRGGCTGTPQTHEFSKNTRTNIILAELNGSHSLVAAANGTFAFARGMTKNLYWNVDGTPGGWRDTTLQPVGTPAVLSGAANPLDLFYRDPSDNIVHAISDGTSYWQALTDITGRIITDPVAVSWGFGRLDVVAIGPDYLLHHWWWNGSAWATESLTGSDRLAVGQPALTTWGANRLDIFYRRHDSKLGHAWTTTGAGPWTFETVNTLTPGGVIKNFPAAVTTPNTVWAYVVGRDNHLYQVTPGTGGSWNTTNVSSAETVLGTASSRRAPTGVRTNYVHVPQSLGAYGLTPPATSWIFTGFSNPGSDLIGSPLANDKGAFVVDSHQSVWLWPAQGGSWTSLGGYVDR